MYLFVTLTFFEICALPFGGVGRCGFIRVARVTVAVGFGFKSFTYSGPFAFLSFPPLLRLGARALGHCLTWTTFPKAEGAMAAGTGVRPGQDAQGA